MSASEARGKEVDEKRPRRLPSGSSRRCFVMWISASSGVLCRLVSCSDFVGELAVDMDMALEASESDSSLILVRSGSKTWCRGTALVMLILPVDLESGDSSIGVEALSLVIDDGESKENDCERMRTFGLGVRGGAASRAAIIAAQYWCNMVHFKASLEEKKCKSS